MKPDHNANRFHFVTLEMLFLCWQLVESVEGNLYDA